MNPQDPRGYDPGGRRAFDPRARPPRDDSRRSRPYRRGPSWRVIVTVIAAAVASLALALTLSRGAPTKDDLERVQVNQAKVLAVTIEEAKHLWLSFLDTCQRLNANIAVSRKLAQLANQGIRSVETGRHLTDDARRVIKHRQKLRRHLQPLDCIDRFHDIRHR